MTKQNVPVRKKGQRQAENAGKRRKTPSLPPNENLKKLPDEVYGDTKIPAKEITTHSPPFAMPGH
jgi:hypothetical protein